MAAGKHSKYKKKMGERHRGRNGDTVEGTGHGMGGERAAVFVAAAAVVPVR